MLMLAESCFRKYRGKRLGRRTSADAVCEKAERLLKGGWAAGNKWELAEHLSSWLSRHYCYNNDAPEMSAARYTETRKFTALWRSRRGSNSPYKS